MADPHCGLAGQLIVQQRDLPLISRTLSATSS
jgi:hypothetical protein